MRPKVIIIHVQVNTNNTIVVYFAYKDGDELKKHATLYFIY